MKISRFSHRFYFIIFLWLIFLLFNSIPDHLSKDKIRYKLKDISQLKINGKALSNNFISNLSDLNEMILLTNNKSKIHLFGFMEQSENYISFIYDDIEEIVYSYEINPNDRESLYLFSPKDEEIFQANSKMSHMIRDNLHLTRGERVLNHDPLSSFIAMNISLANKIVILTKIENNQWYDHYLSKIVSQRRVMNYLNKLTNLKIMNSNRTFVDNNPSLYISLEKIDNSTLEYDFFIEKDSNYIRRNDSQIYEIVNSDLDFLIDEIIF